MFCQFSLYAISLLQHYQAKFWRLLISKLRPKYLHMHAGCVQGVAKDKGLDLVVPAPQLCTDNGVMVAWAGAERLALGLWEHLPASALEDAWVDVRPRWPLTDQCVA